MPRLSLLAGLLAILAAPAASQIAGPATCVAGSATTGGQTFSCEGLDVLSIVPNQAMGASAPGTCTSPYPSLCSNDIWGWVDPTNGREYAIVGLHNGTAFVDVTEPTAPVLLGRLPTATANSSWRDVKTYQNVALVVSEASGHGMQVFDLTRLRGLAADPARTFTADARYTGIGNAHNLVVNEATGFAYAVGASSCSGGLHAIDVRTPTAPTAAGCFAADGYTHDAQCVTYDGPDADYTGREICFASNEDTVTIVDVTDKAAPTQIARAFYPNPSYTHQGWLTDDHRFFIANDELDELFGVVATQRTLALDVSNLDSPEFAFAYDSGLTTIDHNLYVRDGLAYQSNYEAGLRVVYVQDVASGSMFEVAHFDTYPQATTADFNGQWSNYPYFASGTVVASDINNGLFVLRPTNLIVAGAAAPAPAAFDLSAPTPNPTSGTASLTLTVAAPEAVRAVVLDATGREVAVVFDGTVADTATLRVETAGLAAGVYVVRVVGATFSATRRLSVSR